MKTRTVTLTKDDINALETELKSKAASLTDEQKEFSSYLLKLAKVDLKKIPIPPVSWTWTYRF